MVTNLRGFVGKLVTFLTSLLMDQRQLRWFSLARLLSSRLAILDTSMSPVSATPPALRTIGKRPVPKLFGVQMITSFCPGTNYAAACDVERNRNTQSYNIRES